MIINVSGFGWSGSGAVYDLLREYSDIKIALDGKSHFEFALLYDVDGIKDLEYHLVECPRRINSYIAIIRFSNLLKSYNRYFNANSSFKNQFNLISKDYINSLIDFEFKGFTHFEKFQQNLLVAKYNELVKKILANRYTKKWFKYAYINYQVFNISEIKVSYRPEKFQEITIKYLQRLFSVFNESDNLPLLFDQIVPADNPSPFLKFIPNHKCIIVRRDPRDTYLLAKCVYKGRRLPIPTEKVDDFIVFYKKIVQNTFIQDSDTILSLKYEDLIYNYGETVTKIEQFLGISMHVRRKEWFNPEVSVNNTQLFKRYKVYEEDIKTIENELEKSLYPFEKYPVPSTMSSMPIF